MRNTSVPVVNDNLLVEQFDDELILFTASGEKVISLNPTAHLVWRLCHSRLSVHEIIDILTETFPGQAPAITADVMTALGIMADHNIITITD